jgi:hypothetical protein
MGPIVDLEIIAHALFWCLAFLVIINKESQQNYVFQGSAKFLADN